MPEHDDDLIAQLAEMGEALDRQAEPVRLSSVVDHAITVRPRRRRVLAGAVAAAVLLLVASAAWVVGREDGDPVDTVDDAPSLANGACGEGALSGDVDGDGRLDLVNHVYDTNDGAIVRVCLADGRDLTTPGLGQAEALNLIDIEPDGRMEIFAGATSVSSVGFNVTIYRNGRLGPVPLFDDYLGVSEGVLEIDGVGIPTKTSAFGCEDVTGDGRRELVQVIATFTDSNVSWERIVYELTDGVATNIDTDQGSDEQPTDRLSYAKTLIPSCDEESTTSGTSAPTSVEDLVAAIGCSAPRGRDIDPSEPAEPTSAVDCTLGEAQIGIQTYASDQDRDEVMAYLDQFAGFRVVGERWIIAVNTPEAAATVSRLTGGDVVTLAGGDG